MPAFTTCQVLCHQCVVRTLLVVSVISRRPAREPIRAGQTRAAILDATRRLIHARGAFAGLSIAEISTEAGVSRPTFYAYFRDKRDLVLALGADMERDLRGVADPWLRGGDGVLHDTLVAVLEGFRRHASAVAALVEAATYDEDVAAFWRAFHEWFVESGAERAKRATPGLSDEDATAAAFALVWMTERSFTEHLVAPRVTDGALIGAVERLWQSVVGDDSATH